MCAWCNVTWWCSARPGRSAPRRSTWCRANPDRFRVVGLTAGGATPSCSTSRSRSSAGVPVLPRPRRGGVGRGRGAGCDVVLNGITGAVGLRPTLAALDAGNTLALANKESLIIGGPVVTEPRQARPDRPRRLRALRPRPVPARRPAEEVRRLVLTASGGPFRGRTAERAGRRHRRAGAGAPHLGHGPGDHHQLRDPGQQGARGDRGPPALRHPVRPDRGRGAPDERRPLDGGVRRRLHAGPGQPADHADPDRARPRLARPGARRRPGRGLDQAGDLGVLPARRRGLPGGAAGPGGRRGGRHRARGLQRRQRGVRRGVPRGRLEFADIVPTVAAVLAAPRRTLEGRRSPSTTCSPPTPGRARRPARRSRSEPTTEGPEDDRPALHPRAWSSSWWPSWPRSACTSSAT